MRIDSTPGPKVETESTAVSLKAISTELNLGITNREEPQPRDE
jgi:hypothetical protein